MMMSIDYWINSVKGTIIFVNSKGTDRLLKKTVSKKKKCLIVFVSSHCKNTFLVGTLPYSSHDFFWVLPTYANFIP
jgi:hypothetical protein